jgi:WS/DGAT/MGAT family acyltransferase
MTGSRLSAIEALYLGLEAAGSPIHVGSIGIFEGGPLCDQRGRLQIDELRARIAGRLDRVPRLRQGAARVPLGLSRPVWVDSPDFEISDHVDVVSLPAPGDEGALVRLAARLHMIPFSPNRPMWRLTFVTGLSGGRVALVERVGHALVDGVAGVDLATILLDASPDAPSSEEVGWVPAPRPSSSQLLQQSVVEGLALPVHMAAGAMTTVLRPAELRRRAGDLGRAIRGLTSHGLIAPRSSLNRPAGTTRTLALVRQQLAPVKHAGSAVGATTNDVVLAAVAGGLRSLLLGRGEELPHSLTFTILVPVSLRDAGMRGTFGNQVGGLMLPLPVGIGDPVTRLRAIASTTREMKARREVTTSELLLAAGDLLPAPLVAPVGRLLTHQPFANMVVTNVPGPPLPLYAMGAEMLEAFPIVPLAGNLTLGVAVLSYNGALNLGVTADAIGCPDVDAFVTGLERSFAQLGGVPCPTGRGSCHLRTADKSAAQRAS